MAHQQPTDPSRKDDLYRLLATRHRRATLAYFDESSSDVASVEEIADAISDCGGTEQAMIQLHHYALPRLDAADVVDYDTRSNTVRYHGHPDLESVRERVAEL